MRKNRDRNQKNKMDLFGRKVSSRRLQSGSFSKLTRKKPWKGRKKTNEIRVIAPSILNFYNPKHFAATNVFIQNIQKAIKQAHSQKNVTVSICFRNTNLITAASAISLFSETDRSVKKYPNVKFSVVKPPKTLLSRKNKTPFPLVDSVLNRLGFYELLGIPSRHLKELPNVKCWKHAVGRVADGEVAANLIEQAKEAGINTNILYRSSLEALANAVEHAYSKDIPSKVDLTDNRWWMFIAILNGKLTILISDLGHGIPNTLEKTQPQEVLVKIWSLLGGKATTDYKIIEASTLVKRTRTQKQNRGKGGKDLTSIIDSHPGSTLTIFSGHGVYQYRGAHSRKRGHAFETRSPINGTIVEWSIPIANDLDKI
jgi:hypothetical protein